MISVCKWYRKEKCEQALCLFWQQKLTHFLVVTCCALLFLWHPLTQAEEAAVEISDEDLVKLHRLLEEPFPATDPMVPIDPTYSLTVMLREGVDPYPFLRELAFDPSAPLGKRVKSIAWLGEMANPNTREKPDPRVVPCLHELLEELLTNPGIQGPLEQGEVASPPLYTLLVGVFDALSCTRDESSVDLILPLTTKAFWDSAQAPDIPLLPHINYTPEEHRSDVVTSIRNRGIYAIARSGTERSLEILGAGDQMDFNGLKGMSTEVELLDGLLAEAIHRCAGLAVMPKDPNALPEEKRRELEEIRKRVETQYLPLRKKSTD